MPIMAAKHETLNMLTMSVNILVMWLCRDMKDETDAYILAKQTMFDMGSIALISFQFVY